MQDLAITPPTVSNSGKPIKYCRAANNPIISCDAPTLAQLLSGRGLTKKTRKTVRKQPAKRKEVSQLNRLKKPSNRNGPIQQSHH